MRQPPEKKPSPVVKPKTREERIYELITPVFGGGVEVQDHHKPADPVTSIRVASIRGQLRFWWRACNPRGCQTVEELARAEAEVFGSSEKASALSISVQKQPSTPRPFMVLEGSFGAVQGLRGLAYGAFPLRDTGKSNNHGVLHEYKDEWRLAFELRAAPSNPLHCDIEAALWAWGHFGGLGGRTRRGFGAISQTSPKLESIEEGWPKHVTGLRVDWPHLCSDKERWIRRRRTKNAIEAQKMLLEKLRALRQDPLGREPCVVGKNHPGRSFWPEPDAIRRATTQTSQRHSQPVSSVDKLPRGAFGTPIIFHFKDSGDPTDATLQPKVKGRLASPLVLRPHRRSDGSFEALALVLGHPEPPDGYELTWGENGHCDVQIGLTTQEARGLRRAGHPSPMEKDGRVFIDPLERYLEEIR